MSALCWSSRRIHRLKQSSCLPGIFVYSLLSSQMSLGFVSEHDMLWQTPGSPGNGTEAFFSMQSGQLIKASVKTCQIIRHQWVLLWLQTLQPWLGLAMGFAEQLRGPKWKWYWLHVVQLLLQSEGFPEAGPASLCSSVLPRKQSGCLGELEQAQVSLQCFIHLVST